MRTIEKFSVVRSTYGNASVWRGRRTPRPTPRRRTAPPTGADPTGGVGALPLHGCAVRTTAPHPTPESRPHTDGGGNPAVGSIEYTVPYLVACARTDLFTHNAHRDFYPATATRFPAFAIGDCVSDACPGPGVRQMTNRSKEQSEWHSWISGSARRCRGHRECAYLSSRGYSMWRHRRPTLAHGLTAVHAATPIVARATLAGRVAPRALAA